MIRSLRDGTLRVTALPDNDPWRAAVGAGAAGPVVSLLRVATEGTIRILIVARGIADRVSLREIVESEEDMQVVGEAGDARAALLETRAGEPNVILLDPEVRGETSIEAIRRLLAEARHAKVVILSGRGDPQDVRDALAAGVAGYVLKRSSPAEVVTAIREVVAGELYVQPTLGARIVVADLEERRLAESDPLSSREHEVLRLLALGHTNHEVGAMLFISPRTVETHRAHIMQKLRLQTRADLIRYVLRQGSLTAEDAGLQ